MAVLVAAMVLAACGGGEDSLSEGDYREQSQKISDTFDQAFQPALAKGKSKDDPQESLEGVEEVGSACDEAAQELDKLQPPDKFADVQDKLVDSLTSVGDKADEFQQAVAANDRAKAESLQKALETSVAELISAGNQFNQTVGLK